jgi:hypothetical protein
MMERQTNLAHVFIIILSLVVGDSAHATTPEQIGEVVVARGGVSAKYPSGNVRILGKDAPIYQGDVVTSGTKSFAVVKMVDDSRISIRPDTVFAFEEFEIKEGEESAVFRLFKGGMRAISGYLNKRKPEAFKLNTSVATIGIRGTDFDARMCEVDCAIDAQTLKKKKEKKDKTIAKVAFLRGKATAVLKSNAPRDLKIGASIYEGDILKTGEKSHMVVAFNDKSRMTLKANTELAIEDHKFNANDPDKNSATYKLIKGGMRALTGLIGKLKREAYKVKTPTATIGIRGTGFDLVWLGACGGGAASCGLSGSVWSGAIVVQNESGEFELLVNQAFLVRVADTPAIFIDAPPILNIPRPDEVEINFDILFDGVFEDVPTGLYTNIREGIVYMERDGKLIELHAGEGGFVSTDGGVIVKLEQPKSFQTNDPYFETINEEFEALFDLFDDTGLNQNGFECTM